MKTQNRYVGCASLLSTLRINTVLFFAQAYFKMQNVLVDDRRIWVDLYVIWRSRITLFWHIPLIFHIFHSSQSVARFNNSWSNNPTLGPRMGKGKGRSGGFGGRDDLEATRKYREGPADGRDQYDLVFDAPSEDRHKRRRTHSKSPKPDRSREKPRRSRSPRHRDRRQPDHERHRSRDRDRRSRERYDRRY